MVEMIKDRLEVHIHETRDEMGRDAASAVAEEIRRVLEDKEEVNIMFAAAPSQNEVLFYLAASEVDWSRVNAFHMDEYVGLPAGHEASFRSYLEKNIFGKVGFRNVYRIPGEREDSESICSEYAALLLSHPLDICVLGVGENGHIAFNDPPVADFSDPLVVKRVELEEKCRMQQVHDGCFEKLEDVPVEAITVTIPAMVSAKRMYCVVPGPTKSEAVKTLLTGEIGTHCPSSILRRHEHAILYLDRESAALL